MGKTNRVLWGILGLFVVVSVGGCGKDNTSSSGGTKSPNTSNPASGPTDPGLPSVAPLSPASAIDLAKQDIQAFDVLDARGGAAVDAKYNSTFSSIFGGTSGAHVLSYFNQRVHHMIDPTVSGFMPNSFANQNWLTPPVTSNPAGDYDKSARPAESGQAQIGALNIGTLYWLEGLVNQTPVTLYEAGAAPVRVDSSRIGVIMFGDAYVASESLQDGTVIQLPTEYRQSILLHEARHSDCTGGITEAQLKTLRGLRDSAEYERAFASMPCGHLHRICKSGDFAGIAACDIEPWGAYTVGAIYSLAAYATYSASTDTSYPTRLNTAIMKSMFADQISRFQGSTADLLAGKLGAPDMSSQGYHAQ